MHETPTISREMQECIRNCTECHAICMTTLSHCLSMGGVHASQPHITTLLDCAQICQTSADLMLRQSSLHSHTCAACAEICEACARDCERLAGGDRLMMQCADTCRRCAASCRQMSQH